MAENLTIARPYAEAVFETACSDKALDEWQNMLFAMAEACKDRYYLAYLKNSSNADEAAKGFIKLLDGVINPKGENFIRLLCENGRFEVIPEIYEEFVSLREKHDKVLSVQLISARKVADTSLRTLKKKLADKYNCVINLEKKVDPSLIGGVVLKIGDEVIDASFRTSLKQLSSTLR